MTPHFHSIEDGCDIEKGKTKINKPDAWGENIVIYDFCKTHNTEICQCGWEWQWHYGIYIKSFQWKKQLKNQLKLS